MLVKVKDVARTAPVVVTVAPINSLRSRRLALLADFVPRATAAFTRAREVSRRRVQEFSLQFNK
jgi:hypothetical protein